MERDSDGRSRVVAGRVSNVPEVWLALAKDRKEMVCWYSKILRSPSWVVLSQSGLSAMCRSTWPEHAATPMFRCAFSPRALGNEIVCSVGG